ncbi:MAG: hypothetical protein ACT4NY_19100 [Pseudonocardiales bacterium]
MAGRRVPHGKDLMAMARNWQDVRAQARATGKLGDERITLA